MTSPSIAVPAGFAPAHAMGYADVTGQLALVSGSAPLPVALAGTPPAPLVGQTAISALVGPFEAVAGRTIIVTLAGEWAGTVRLQRSTDGGESRASLRVGGMAWAEYTQSGCEQAWTVTEDGVSFYLDIELASGVVEYRVSQ